MREEIEKITAVVCPRIGELVPIELCEECEYFEEEFAEYIVCSYPVNSNNVEVWE